MVPPMMANCDLCKGPSAISDDQSSNDQSSTIKFKMTVDRLMDIQIDP
jgi:hypothetical protein